ncbi:unnamed protein product [Symbiodinium natans]|uniref:Uncharacterized protein n=1 Tax=Symbiodinium natans TaxID=878477 RepID=A0A812J632_9DINO|nr:unnamed protein product [Symbiodinium natans]
MSRSIFMFASLAATVAAETTTIGTATAEDYWQGDASQDVQLIFSFNLGILFVRSAETIFDDPHAGDNRRLKKLELYPLLA